MFRHKTSRFQCGYRLIRATLFCLLLGVVGPVESRGDDLLPDLVPWASQSRGYVYDWYIDPFEMPGRSLMRLSTTAANIGAGPLEIEGVDPDADEHDHQHVLQRIYDTEGGFRERDAGLFEFHPEHQHTHLEDFARYALMDVLADESVGEIVAGGEKTSFCLLDSVPYDRSLSGAPGTREYFTCDAGVQGISVGWADVYGAYLPDQWIDVTGVPVGEYWLQVHVDPADHLEESNENNNVLRIKINLQGNTLAGDLNFDQVVDDLDIDILAHMQGFVNGDLDVDESGGAADQMDLDYLITSILGTTYGDANLDGVVNMADFEIWRVNRMLDADLSGSVVEDERMYGRGDFNLDGAIDGFDFAIWQAAFGVGESKDGEVANVPEPGGMWLFGLVAGFLGMRPRY